MNRTTQPFAIEQIAELADRYRYFLVDQFGVLHDGYTAYPGAVDALRSLKKSGATIVVISNSGKRAKINKARLEALGFTRDCYDDLVSSGEVAWNLLKQQYIGSRLPEGARCYLFSNDNDRSALDGLDLSIVDNLDAAEVLVLAGVLLDNNGLEALYKKLQTAVKNKVLCFCTNPDKIAYAKTGKLFSAGTVAEWYEKQGGEVIWLGKPYPEIYRYVLDHYRIAEKSEAICIGDSIEHDIKGGAAQGIATVLVRSGILDDCDEQQVSALYQQHGAVPTYVIKAFA